MKRSSTKLRREKRGHSAGLIALAVALVLAASSQAWAQYAPYQGGPPLGPGSLAPQQPMPTSAVPGNFTYGTPQTGFMGEQPAYGQPGVAGGASACSASSAARVSAAITIAG